MTGVTTFRTGVTLAGGHAEAITTDVTDEDALTALAQAAVEYFWQAEHLGKQRRTHIGRQTSGAPFQCSPFLYPIPDPAFCRRSMLAWFLLRSRRIDSNR